MKHQIADDLTTLAYPIEKLKHLDGNPRKGNVEAVKKSYEKFGQRKPIVATKDGEVISGNHQLAAARELGWNKIAVVFTNDDELTAKAFALADNRTADLGTYDDDLLADMLGSVSSNPEMFKATSFTNDDLYNISATLSFDDVFDNFETGDRTTMFTRSFYFNDNDIEILENTISKYLQINDLPKNKENKTSALIEFCNYWNNDN
tara:strand:- start:1184 stop:1798 length:615 start_codon:yes stop_codon:yes gene_type:complete